MEGETRVTSEVFVIQEKGAECSEPFRPWCKSLLRIEYSGVVVSQVNSRCFAMIVVVLVKGVTTH